ncbi:MAG: hypothetical protein HY770_04665 [Chitinivibrionia bacterium]|nr:hypothetical protein [Chitinivibrionia bacterium]
MSAFFLTLAFLSVAWGIVSMIAVVSFLSSRGVKINYFLIRILIFRYVNEYHKLTKQERGKPGRWYYSYIISMNTALVCAIIGLLLR